MRTLIYSIALATFIMSAEAMAASDAGHSKDYRTFKAGGEIAYGQIGDSYTSDLVM